MGPSAFVCASCSRALKNQSPRQSLYSCSRTFSTVPAHRQRLREDMPRWKQTPPEMKMPFRLRPRSGRKPWTVNEEPEVLDLAMDRFFGRMGPHVIKGRDVLSDEVKWLAVTHKSFDYGRRGNNDRLAWLGKRLVEVQTSLALLQREALLAAEGQNPFNSAQLTPELLPFRHPSLDGVNAITNQAKYDLLDKRRLAGLVDQYGLGVVTRWKPLDAEELLRSGAQVVLAQTLYALVGAVNLERGGEMAKWVVKERILARLGLAADSRTSRGETLWT